MKRFLVLFGLFTMFLTGCSPQEAYAPIAATTLPVYEFTTRLCQGTDLGVARLVNESVSCLHDYSLNVKQVKLAEKAELIVLSGAGLEDFMADLLTDKNTLDASQGIELLESCHEHDHEHDHDHDHSALDSHIWLSPGNALLMAGNIYHGLCQTYPQHTDQFQANFDTLQREILALQAYGQQTLSGFAGAEIITFHDGFSYFAQCYDLHILRSIEEESGAEASAAELIDIIHTVQEHDVRAIFTETNGSNSAAQIISTETGAGIFTLDMAMAGDSWFDAMYHNIDTMKEALE